MVFAYKFIPSFENAINLCHQELVINSLNPISFPVGSANFYVLSPATVHTEM